MNTEVEKKDLEMCLCICELENDTWVNVCTYCSSNAKIPVFWDITLCHCVNGSQHFYKSYYFTLKLMALWSFKTVGTTCTAAKCHILKEWKLEKNMAAFTYSTYRGVSHTNISTVRHTQVKFLCQNILCYRKHNFKKKKHIFPYKYGYLHDRIISGIYIVTWFLNREMWLA